VLQWLHSHATPVGITICLAISRVGSPLTITILAIAGGVALAMRREWILLGGWAVAFTGASALDRWLKLAVHRPRPVYAARLMHHATWSFPSGHAMGSVVGFGMLAYVVLVLGPRSRPMRRLIVTASVGLIAAVGISRLYLGVHYVSDVIGGYVAGLLWLSGCIAATETARHWRNRPLRLHPMG
jgi:undecaprenyl-diphosphatase